MQRTREGKMRIRMARPSLGEPELEAVRAVLESGWLGEGKITEQFEARLRDYTGAPHAIAVNTGTSALHLCLASRGIGPGDEVILPSFTFAGDAMAVCLCGGTPVFADIRADTLNLDPASVMTVMSRHTRAIMLTDYSGLPADVRALKKTLGRDDVLLIRDAAHSFGSLQNGAPVGLNQSEDATCFSFDPIKHLTCGEGGAVLVGDPRWATLLARQRNLGFATRECDSQDTPAAAEGLVSTIGYRYHLGNLNAAIGLAQFDTLPARLAAKRRVARRYDTLLADVEGVRPFARDYDEVAPFLYPVMIGGGRRDHVAKELGRKGIHAGLRYTPCHHQPLFASSRSAELPVTEQVGRELLCLPIHAGLTDDEVDEVVGCVRACF
jgi:dTDP-4-amino-4,6-dideoxygalactose transaminase